MYADLALVRGLLAFVEGDWSLLDGNVELLEDGVCVFGWGLSQISQLSSMSSKLVWLPGLFGLLRFRLVALLDCVLFGAVTPNSSQKSASEAVARLFCLAAVAGLIDADLPVLEGAAAECGLEFTVPAADLLIRWS